MEGRRKTEAGQERSPEGSPLSSAAFCPQTEEGRAKWSEYGSMSRMFKANLSHQDCVLSQFDTVSP